MNRTGMVLVDHLFFTIIYAYHIVQLYPDMSSLLVIIFQWEDFEISEYLKMSWSSCLLLAFFFSPSPLPGPLLG